MNLLEVLQTRYSAKEFDPLKKISHEDFEKIKAILRLSPSSVNSQPWHFVITDTEQGKKMISKSTQGFFDFNNNKVLHASHVIVLCAKNDLDEDYLKQVLEVEEVDGRFATNEIKDYWHNGRTTFVNIHKEQLNDLQHWIQKQVYLNMGTLLLGAATLGIDAVAMEGFDAKVLDEELGLSDKGYTPVCIVTLGYHSDSDFNAKLPKSRLKEEELFTVL